MSQSGWKFESKQLKAELESTWAFSEEIPTQNQILEHNEFP